MSNPSNSLRRKRPDLTPFLFHFTSGATPEANLKSILAQKKLLFGSILIKASMPPIKTTQALLRTKSIGVLISTYGIMMATKPI